MLIKDKTYIVSHKASSRPVVLYKSEDLGDSNYSVRKFIAAGLVTLFVGVLSLQTGWVLNANAEGNPITSPISTQESPTPTPSASTSPITAPEVPSPTPSLTPSIPPISSPEVPTPTPSASPTSAPITSPEVTPTPSATPAPYFKLHFPNGGEVFNVGDFVRIGWEQAGLENYNCVFSYVNDNDVYGTHLFLINPLQLYFNWIVDISGLAMGGSTKVKANIACNDPMHNGVFDRSDDFFTVNYPHPTVAPSVSPSIEPSASPSAQPSVIPSPSIEPSASASATPVPTAAPANNPSNEGSASSGGSVSAPSCDTEAPKSAPKILSAVNTGKNQVTLTWDKAAGPVSHYVITYGVEKNKPLYGNPNTGNVTSYTVKGLSGGLTYYFKVRASNDCKPGEFSQEIGVKVDGQSISTPAQGFKPGVLGKSTNAITPAVQSTPAPSATPALQSSVEQPEMGLLGKLFNFFAGLFS